MKINLKTFILGFTALTLIACATTQTSSSSAEHALPSWPAAEPKIQSAIFSRTSLTVRSIDESLKLYRDVLGMTPFYERLNLDDPRLIPFSNLQPGQKMNLTVLRIETNGPHKVNSGYLGLTEIRDVDDSLTPLPELTRSAANYGAATLMFMVPSTMDTYKDVRDLGYEIISAPKQREGGGNTQLLMRGPDGERLWIGETSNFSIFLDPNQKR